MVRSLRSVLVLLWVCTLASFATAQTVVMKPYAVPEDPANTFLGVSAAKVSRPTTARALGTELLNGIDSSGRLQQGLAVNFQVWPLLPGVSIGLKDYQSNRLQYMLANTELSLATVRSSGDSASTDLGLGLRITIFDDTDPMSDTVFTGVIRNAIVLAGPDGSDQDLERIIATARTKWLDGHKTGYGLAVAAATGWTFRNSILKQSVSKGWSAWITGAYPLWKFGEVLGQCRYDAVRISDSITAGVLSYGLRANIGGTDWNVYAEATGNTDSKGLVVADTTHFNWGIGIEYRVADKMWLSTGLGQGFGNANKDDKIVMIANMRWVLSTGPKLGN